MNRMITTIYSIYYNEEHNTHNPTASCLVIFLSIANIFPLFLCVWLIFYSHLYRNWHVALEQ
jgi:hypothetical protein